GCVERARGTAQTRRVAALADGVAGAGCRDGTRLLTSRAHQLCAAARTCASARSRDTPSGTAGASEHCADPMLGAIVGAVAAQESSTHEQPLACNGQSLRIVNPPGVAARDSVAHAADGAAAKP